MTEPPFSSSALSSGSTPPERAVMSGPTSGWLGSVVVHSALLTLLLVVAEGPFGPGAGGGPGGEGSGSGNGTIEASFGFGAELKEETAGAQAEIIPASFESPTVASPAAVIPVEAASPAWVAPAQVRPAEWTQVATSTVPASGSTAHNGHSTGSGAQPFQGEFEGGFGSGAATDAGTGGGPDLGGGTGRGGTSLFGITDAGARYVYVIDRSISMQDYGALDAARSELAASLSRINSTEEFQIIFFNHEFHLLTPRRGDEFFRGIDAHRRLAIAQMQLIPAEGATRSLPALLEALRLKPDIIFFLTDGDRPRLSADELRRVRQKNGGRARIHCIRFVNSPDETAGAGNWLAQLAAENSGRYVVHDVRRGVNSN